MRDSGGGRVSWSVHSSRSCRDHSQEQEENLEKWYDMHSLLGATMDHPTSSSFIMPAPV